MEKIERTEKSGAEHVTCPYCGYQFHTPCKVGEKETCPKCGGRAKIIKEIILITRDQFCVFLGNTEKWPEKWLITGDHLTGTGQRSIICTRGCKTQYKNGFSLWVWLWPPKGVFNSKTHLCLSYRPGMTNKEKQKRFAIANLPVNKINGTLRAIGANFRVLP